MAPIISARGGLSSAAYGQFSAALAGGSYESIATTSLSSSQSSVTFTESGSAWSRYKHLQIRAMAGLTGTNNDYWNLPFYVNGDTGSNYARHGLRGSGASVSAVGAATQTRMYLYDCMPNFTDTSKFGVFVIDLLDFNNTSKYKTMRGLSGTDGNGSGGIALCSSAWFNTNAITSITFEADAGLNFRQYSTFALYGIKD